MLAMVSRCLISATPEVILMFYLAGDSRAIVVQKGGRCKVMSMDHRPDRYTS